jgi:hypothetical protein
MRGPLNNWWRIPVSTEPTRTTLPSGGTIIDPKTTVDTFEAQAATTTEDRSIIQISISAPDSGPQEFAGK